MYLNNKWKTKKERQHLSLTDFFLLNFGTAKKKKERNVLEWGVWKKKLSRKHKSGIKNWSAKTEWKMNEWGKALSRWPSDGLLIPATRGASWYTSKSNWHWHYEVISKAAASSSVFAWSRAIRTLLLFQIVIAKLAN